ncbi:variant surface glycoprotein (VSG), putative [Trypanosoma equiperdum]|uniref:Variant surface glycoprotein (VSG), putative n=1 Tax=Trypanosoma equiperdum TaxID=5694 RepID=A0A1G4I1S0_TRYEQ|nr:variant surface glycoprotein (VSG), putative [Trypanosoma equiperdum]
MFSGKVAILVLTTSFIAKKACATFVALPSESWKPQCRLAKELRKLPGLSKSKVDGEFAAYAALEKTRLRLLIFATKNPGDTDAVLLRALAEAAEAKQETIRTAAAAMVQKGLKATAYAAEMAGAITSAIQTLKAANDGTNYCLNKNSKTGNGNTDVDSEGCQTLDFQAELPPDTLNGGVIDTDGFKTNTGLTGPAAKGQTDKCGFFAAAQGAQSATAGVQIGSGGAKISLGLGLIEAEASNTPSRKDLSNFKTTARNEATTFFGKAHAAIMELNQETSNPLGTESAEAIMKALTLEPAALAAIKQQLAASETDGKISGYDNRDNALKTDYFGAAGEKITPLWNKVKDENVAGSSDVVGKEVKLSSLKTEQQLRQVLLYYRNRTAKETTRQQQEIDRLTKANTAATKGAETDATCEKKGKEDNCKDGCKWDTDGENKECVVDSIYKTKQTKEAKAEDKKEEKCKKHGTN